MIDVTPSRVSTSSAADASSPADRRAATTALIKRYYTAFNAGDVEGMLACVADDVVHDVNQGARRVGKAQFAKFCAHMSLCYSEQLVGITVLSNEQGDRAAAEFNVHGTYLQTDEGLPAAMGQKYVLPGGTFFAIENGLIGRITTYYNLTDWLVQVSGGIEP